MSKATLSIGAVARLFDISTKTLRHYEELGLLTPARADNGYRCYRPADVQQILRIRQLQALGLTLEQIHDILENELDEDRWQHILQTILADINGQLDALTVRRQRVQALLEGEELVEAVAAQPLAMPELEEALLYLEGQLPELSLLPLWQEQTIMGLLDPAGALLADLFARAAPPVTLPGQPIPY
jgi:DNA-binding transcriptional MerR regulator